MSSSWMPPGGPGILASPDGLGTAQDINFTQEGHALNGALGSAGHAAARPGAGVERNPWSPGRSGTSSKSALIWDDSPGSLLVARDMDGSKLVKAALAEP